jgi:hypothetical protein
VGAGQVDDLAYRVEVSGIGVASGGHDHGRSSLLRPERAFQCLEIEPANAVACERGHAPAADTQHPQGFHGAGVDDPAGEDREARQPGPPILIDVDVVLQRPPPPRRRQPDIVGHCAAGDEHSAPRRRQGEELLQPVDGHDFHPGAEW